MEMPKKLRVRANELYSEANDDFSWLEGFNSCYKELEPLIEALKYYSDDVCNSRTGAVIGPNEAKEALKKIGIE